MTSSDPLPARSASPRSPLGTLLIAFVVTSSFAKATLPEVGPAEFSPPPTRAADTPPEYPDARHVPNGCYLSATAYLAKFTAAFPAETAMPVSIQCAELHGPHTVAVVQWKNRWWLRDEFFGLVPLTLTLTPHTALADDEIKGAAQAAFSRHLERMVARTRNRIVENADRIAGAVAPARDVATAAALLPFASEPFRVVCPDREINLLFFRPGPGRVAVYDPLTGTAAAECMIADDAKVVALIAARLGYRSESIHRESRIVPAALVAANDVSRGGLDR